MARSATQNKPRPEFNPSESDTTLATTVSPLLPEHIIMGGIWIGPGGGDNGDGNRPDLGQENADAAVDACLQAGIREFDTAPWYGSGACEERLGRALNRLGCQDALVVTKAGRIFREADGTDALSGFDEPGRGLESLRQRVCINDYSADGTDISLAHSLDRLGAATVHGIRIHDPNDNSNNRVGSDTFVDEVEIATGQDGMIERLRELRETGVIRHIGIGMNSNREQHMGAPDQILRLIQLSPPDTFDSALLAGGWNLLNQDGLECLVECQNSTIPVHVAGVFASGLLASEYGTYAYQKAPADMAERARRWGQLAVKHGVSLPAVAIAFAAMPSCVARMVLGLASAEQVEDTLQWVKESALVPAQIWADAKEEGLLSQDCPTQ